MTAHPVAARDLGPEHVDRPITFRTLGTSPATHWSEQATTAHLDMVVSARLRSSVHGHGVVCLVLAPLDGRPFTARWYVDEDTDIYLQEAQS